MERRNKIFKERISERNDQNKKLIAKREGKTTWKDERSIGTEEGTKNKKKRGTEDSKRKMCEEQKKD